MKIFKYKGQAIKILPKKEEKARPKIVKILPVGRWCEYYENRLPFPVECQFNSDIPLCIEKPNCKKCNRKVLFSDWKEGKWRNIATMIEKGENLSGMENPFIDKELLKE